MLAFNSAANSPTLVRPGCSKKVWWKCNKGHEWERGIKRRVEGGLLCPICYLEQQVETNSFSKKYPHLLQEWDYEKMLLTQNP